MGFNSVYRGLQEAFPQIDSRILKAVAIEHPKDVDTAAEVVLLEVIPFLPTAAVHSGSSGDLAVEAAYHPGTGEIVPLLDSIEPNEATSSLNDSSYSDVNGNGDQVYGNEEAISYANHESSLEPGLEVASGATSISAALENTANNMYSHVQDSLDTEENVSLLNNSVGCSARQGSSVFSANEDTGGFSPERQNFTVPSASECLVVVNGEFHGQLREDGKQVNEEVQVPVLPVQGSSIDVLDGIFQLAVKQTMNTEELEPRSAVAIASNVEVSSSTMADDFGNESALNSVETRSAQVCSVDLLEDIIEDARNNKKTLFSAMETVISLMREVELQEKATKLAKEEALRGGFEIYSNVEEMKQLIRHAKEGNDMHAGEVYGEKAILATEMRELQSRLLSLSEEKNNSLAILDEMRQSLGERLDASEKARKLAEEERMEKEALSRVALAEQHQIMEKVVQESKMLKQQAEENSKLQEFLMDRGRVVDTLQGEISVICQDVKLLKQKFDERVPLSKSLSSSQTTCLLASSSSSLKSAAYDQFPEQVDEALLTLEKLSRESSLNSDQPLPPLVVVREGNDGSALLDDDGWEFFESQEAQAAH